MVSIRVNASVSVLRISIWGHYLPLRTKYFYPFKGLCFIGVALSQGLAVWRWRNESGRQALWLMLVLSLSLPAAYAIGGAFFSWYFWPYQLLGFMVALAMVSKAAQDTRVR